MSTDNLHQHHYKSSFLDSILNSARFGIASYEPIRNNDGKITDFLITYTNWEVPANFGLTPEDVIGKTCSEVYPGIFKNGVFEKMVAAMESGRPDAYEIEVMRNGESLWLSAAIEVVNGSVNMTSKNITSEKQAALHLENMNKMLARKNEELASFAFIASHDLQEPLRKIMMFISRILEKEKDFSPQSQMYFSNITTAAQRMQNLISDLLTYSKLDADPLSKEKVDFEEMLAEATAELDDHESVVIADKLPVINAIPSQINQLLTNIIGNSVKYRKPEIDLKITVTSDVVEHNRKKYYKVSIADNGIGFDPQYKEKIFEVFQRLHGKQEYSGTGVGLSICKKIMENHNGFIEADGTPGEGAIFSMYFPVKGN